MRFFLFGIMMKNNINIKTVLSDINYELQKLFDSAPPNTFDYLDLVQLFIQYKYEQFAKQLELHKDLLESLLTRLEYANIDFNVDEIFAAEKIARKILEVYDNQYKFIEENKLDYPFEHR